MTTTDALQVIQSYCPPTEDFKKETRQCLSDDEFIPNLKRPIYADRICDGIADCPNAEDEFDALGTCEKYPILTENGCCKILYSNGVRCEAEGVQNGRDLYRCDDSDDHLLFFDQGEWVSGTLQDGFFSVLMVMRASNTSFCLPEGQWEGSFPDNFQRYVFCHRFLSNKAITTTHKYTTTESTTFITNSTTLSNTNISKTGADSQTTRATKLHITSELKIRTFL